MAPLDIDTALEWRGRTVVDRDGDKIGKLEELYLDESDRPAWGSVSTGLFGRRQSFVPLADLREAGDDLQVPYGKDHVKDAPNADPDEQLSPQEEDALHRHYGLDGPPERDAETRETAAAGDTGGGDETAETAEAERGRETREPASGAEARPAEGRPETDGDRDARPADDGAEARSADDAREARSARPAGEEGVEMIRSEEEVDVGTRRRVRGRARLKKYVVTEHVQKVVPVQREEVRVEFDPADGDEEAGVVRPVRDEPARRAEQAGDEPPPRER
jgi:hypothetical protein